MSPKRHQDPEWLHEMYHERGLPTEEIGELAGVTGRAVRYAMEKHGIPRRSASEAKTTAHLTAPVPIEQNYDGYVMWTHTHRKERERVYVHRLLAVAKFGFDAVRDKDVHHLNGCKFDNRPENIGLLTRADHTRLHHSPEPNND